MGEHVHCALFCACSQSVLALCDEALLEEGLVLQVHGFGGVLGLF